MPKRCVFCSRFIGLFTRQAYEVKKEGLCLCKNCYSTLWLTQSNPKSQAKRLASIALNGKLSPEIKKAVVRRIKELLPVEEEQQEAIEQISELKSVDFNNAINQEPIGKEVIKLSVEKKSVFKNEPSTPTKKESCTKNVSEEVSPTNFKESLVKESVLDCVNNPYVTIVSDSSYPDLHFWADTPISICGVVIERPFLYTIGESKLEEELEKNLTYCKFEDNPYLNLYRMFFEEDEIQRNRDLFTSYLDSDKILNHVFVLPKDDKLIIPAENPSQEEIDKLCMNSATGILVAFSKEQSGCFIKWLSNYYPNCIHARFFTSEYLAGVWYRTFVEKKDLRAVFHFWGNFVLSGEGYNCDEYDKDDVNELRRFFALLLIYTREGNVLTQEEKQLVSSSIKKTFSIKYHYIYRRGWKWDPIAILHECGCDECIPQWLILKQYLAVMADDGKFDGSKVVQFYFQNKELKITPIFFKKKIPVGYIQDFKGDWVCNTPYYTTWTISNKETIDQSIEKVIDIINTKSKLYTMIPTDIKPEKAIWFKLPDEMQREIDCPLTKDEILDFIKEGQSLRDIFKRFGQEYSRMKVIPKNATTKVEKINYFYECLGVV